MILSSSAHLERLESVTLGMWFFQPRLADVEKSTNVRERT